MKATHTVLRLVAILVSGIGVQPSRAGEAECRFIADALERMTQQPLVQQVDTRSDFPGPIETIFAQDAFYASAGGQWKKIDVTGAVRLAQLKTVLETSPLNDCARVEELEIEGIATASFRYRQSPPGEGAQAIDMKIWVGIEDNLPYRWEGGVVTSAMKYKGVSVPPL